MFPIRGIYVPNPTVTAARPNPKTFGLMATGEIRHLSGPDVDLARMQTPAVPTVEIRTTEHYDQLNTNSKKGLPA